MTGKALLRDCQTLVFDCDGVILDSNRIKTEAFLQVARRYGNAAAEELVRFHIANGGVSRYRKFEHLLSHILHRPANPEEIAGLAAEYGERVYNELLACPAAPGLAELREATASKHWMVVSGGDESELRRVFAERGMMSMFDCGIHGSPATKDAILSREAAAGRLQSPAIFLGDSRYDHEAASRAGLGFVFVHGWTEFSGWREYCETHSVPTVVCTAELVPLLG